MLTPDTLIAFGTAVKATADGAIEGYLVQFGGPDATDLEREYFTAATEYGVDLTDGKSVTLPLFYGHGFNPSVGKRRIGTASIKADDKGLWLRAELDKAEAYRAQILALAKQGKLGASSGAVSHLLVKEADADGKAVHIKQWPLGEASLTVQPCDPRNILTAKELVKSYIMSPANNRQRDYLRGGSEKYVSQADAADADTYFTEWDEAYITTAALYRLNECLMSGVDSVLCSFDDADPEEARAYLTGLFAEYAERAVALVFAIQSGMGDETPQEAAKSLQALYGNTNERHDHGVPPAGLPFLKRAEAALAAVARLTDDAKAVQAYRVKEGRKLSADSRAKLGEMATQLTGLQEDLTQFLAACDGAYQNADDEALRHAGGERNSVSSGEKSADVADIRRAVAEHLRREAQRLGVALD